MQFSLKKRKSMGYPLVKMAWAYGNWFWLNTSMQWTNRHQSCCQCALCTAVIMMLCIKHKRKKRKLHASNRLSRRTCVISGRNLLRRTEPGVSSSSNCTHLTQQQQNDSFSDTQRYDVIYLSCAKTVASFQIVYHTKSMATKCQLKLGR